MITFVTSNSHKFREIQSMFRNAGMELAWEEMSYEEIQADTTEEVSMDSCRKLQEQIQGDFFLEDSGIFIDSLNGFPGVYSSYAYRTIGLDGILALIHGREKGAHFKTVLTASTGGKITQHTGILEGRIAEERSGEGGFGFDPVFIPEGHDETLAEMGMGEKNAISHRSRAVKAFLEFLGS